MNILDIKFKDSETKLKELQGYFNDVGQDALYMSHYELAEITEISPIDWKEFLTDPRVAATLTEELEMIKKAKVAKMLSTVDTNKNTGQAQLLNTLLNQTKGSDTKEGPVFIYTQIPLNDEELNAPNVEVYDVNNTH